MGMFRNLFDSPVHLLILLLVIVIVFGWKKLPDAARSVGRSMRIFKAEVEEMKHDKPTSAASRDTVNGEHVTRTETTVTREDAPAAGGATHETTTRTTTTENVATPGAPTPVTPVNPADPTTDTLGTDHVASGSSQAPRA